VFDRAVLAAPHPCPEKSATAPTDPVRTASPASPQASGCYARPCSAQPSLISRRQCRQHRNPSAGISCHPADAIRRSDPFRFLDQFARFHSARSVAHTAPLQHQRRNCRGGAFSPVSSPRNAVILPEGADGTIRALQRFCSRRAGAGLKPVCARQAPASTMLASPVVRSAWRRRWKRMLAGFTAH